MCGFVTIERVFCANNFFDFFCRLSWALGRLVPKLPQPQHNSHYTRVRNMSSATCVAMPCNCVGSCGPRALVLPASMGPLVDDVVEFVFARSRVDLCGVAAAPMLRAPARCTCLRARLGGLRASPPVYCLLRRSRSCGVPHTVVEPYSAERKSAPDAAARAELLADMTLLTPSCFGAHN